MPPEQAAPDVWTVGRIIDWTTQHLKKHGSDTPRLDTEILLAKARGCPRIQLYVDYAVPLKESERATMRDLVRRRAQHEPVAYLVGHREFFGLNFRVNADVLIPRPETETLVLEVITAARKRGEQADPSAASESPAESHEPATEPRTSDQAGPNTRRPMRVLDLGTGSGCIAVSCAVHVPEAVITAIDISSSALAVARDNAAAHSVSDRIRFLEGDLFAPLAEAEQFEVIVSNPPYVADGDMETLPGDVRLHEPHLALRAGPEGLDVISRLVAAAGARLVAGGLLLIEISPEQADAVVALVASRPEFESTSVLKDSTGRLRAIRARRTSSPTSR